MTVKELKQLLDTFDDDDIIVISKDSEGNEYSPLFDADSGFYFEENSWSGDFVTGSDLEDDKDINLSHATPAIVLWPTN